MQFVIIPASVQDSSSFGDGHSGNKSHTKVDELEFRGIKSVWCGKGGNFKQLIMMDFIFC